MDGEEAAEDFNPDPNLEFKTSSTSQATGVASRKGNFAFDESFGVGGDELGGAMSSADMDKSGARGCRPVP